jgi:hypothetical protein
MFTLHTFNIELKKYGGKIKFIPWGDVHYDEDGCDRDRFHDFLRRCKLEDDDNTIYLDMGDPNGFSSTSERDILCNRKLHDSTRGAIDRFARRSTMEFIDKIKFMKGRLLGVMEGNHHWEFSGTKPEDKITSDQLIAREMGAKFLGRMTYIRVRVSAAGGVHFNFDIVAHHGNFAKGSSSNKCAGTTLNKVDDLRRVFPVADIYLAGHDHKRGGIPESTLVVDSASGNSKDRGGLVLKQKRQWLCRTGSFLRAYVDGEQSYVSDAAMRPCELGVVRFEIGCKRDRTSGKDARYPDIHLLS